MQLRIQCLCVDTADPARLAAFSRPLPARLDPLESLSDSDFKRVRDPRSLICLPEALRRRPQRAGQRGQARSGAALRQGRVTKASP